MAAVGKGSTGEVLYGNSRQGSDRRSPTRQQSARVRREKSYTATVGNSPAEEVLHGNSRQGSGGKVLYGNSRQGSDGDTVEARAQRGRRLQNLENLFVELKEAQMSYLKAAESSDVIKEEDFLLRPSKSMGESRARAGKQKSFRVLQPYEWALETPWRAPGNLERSCGGTRQFGRDDGQGGAGRQQPGRPADLAEDRNSGAEIGSGNARATTTASGCYNSTRGAAGGYRARQGRVQGRGRSAETMAGNAGQHRPGLVGLKEDRGGGGAAAAGTAADADADHAPGGVQGASPDNGPGPADIRASTTAAWSRQAAVQETEDRKHFCAPVQVYDEKHVSSHPQAVRGDDVRCTTRAGPAGVDVEFRHAGRPGRQKLQHEITSQRRRRSGGGSHCGGGTAAGEVPTAGEESDCGGAGGQRDGKSEH